MITDSVNRRSWLQIQRVQRAAFALCMCVTPQVATGQRYAAGVPPEQLIVLGRSLPPKSSLEAVLIFNDLRKRSSSVAVLGDVQHGRRLFIFAPAKSGRYTLLWHSSLLTGSFSQDSSQPLKLEPLANEDAVAFSGCAQHMCPEIFSTLLYVSSQHRAFIGTCDRGTTHYDFVLTANHEEVRSALDKILADTDHYGNANACSPKGSGNAH